MRGRAANRACRGAHGGVGGGAQGRGADSVSAAKRALSVLFTREIYNLYIVTLCSSDLNFKRFLRFVCLPGVGLRLGDRGG